MSAIFANQGSKANPVPLLDNTRVIYLAYNNRTLHPGVQQKITQTVESLNDLGYAANAVILPPPFSWLDLRMAKEIIKANAEIIIFRSHPLMLPCAFALALKRLAKTKIIIDVPTPYQAVWEEIKLNYGDNKIKLFAALLIILITFPWCLLPANKIIQYAPDSRYFSLCLKRKTQIHTNGIDTSQVPVRLNYPAWPNDEFIMVAVGRLAPWHAYDRIIKGIANYQQMSKAQAPTPRLIIVGDGPIRSQWEDLAHSMGVSDLIQFVGYKTGADLDAIFAQSHIAISSLGLFKKNLAMASDLKSREYAARGLPFVAAANDLDFDPVPWFVYQVSNTNSPLDIYSLMKWYGRICTQLDFMSEIRLYAEERLDFRLKAKRYLG